MTTPELVVPIYAAPWPSAAYRRFRQLFGGALASRGLVVVWHDDEGYVEARDPRAPNEEIHLGLHNIIKAAQDVALDGWPGLIERHLGILDRSRSLTTLDWASARGRLVTKLYRAEVELPDVLTRPLTMELVEAVVVDLPDSIMSVTGRMAQRWGESPAALFAAGRTGLRARRPPARTELFGGRAFSVLAEDFYAGSQVLVLDDLVPDHERGALVILPSRDLLCFAPLRRPDDLSDVPLLAALAEMRQASGSAELSTLVHWWHDGQVEPIEIEIIDGIPRLAPAALWRRLAGQPGEGGPRSH